ncbi:MAG: hypothetical protein KatS3mg007_2038 [Thermoanaerobaculum sp.]|nr:MAG: hypothetical protein KatS3mg007_2038 [Thermoanaerobaculum sp.]
MPSKAFLRTLIVGMIVLGSVSVVVSLVTESLLPDPLRAYAEAEWEANLTGRDVVMLAVAILVIIAWFVSCIGLFLFWRPARILYLITITAGLLLTPLYGPYVDAGWGTMFEDAAVILSGVILALVYLSPLKGLYEKPKLDR